MKHLGMDLSIGWQLCSHSLRETQSQLSLWCQVLLLYSHMGSLRLENETTTTNALIFFFLLLNSPIVALVPLAMVSFFLDERKTTVGALVICRQRQP